MSEQLPARAASHFPWSEFACKDNVRTPYPLDYRIERGVPLGTELECLRDIIGPFTPTSVYRTWAYHAAIYAAMKPPQVPPPQSQHLYGRAADVPCPWQMEWARFVQAVLDIAHREGGRVRYVKFYRHGQFAHLDIRLTDRLKVEYST